MKAKRHSGVNDAAKTRLNVRISEEAQKRLGVHCVMSGMQPGEILEKLIVAHCRDWKVSANVVARVIAIDSVVDAHDVNLSA